VRLYDPTSRCRPGPRSFRHNGPRLRFDHHRPAPDGSPTNDPKRSVYYAALTLSCALVEVFGDGGVIERAQWQLALSTLRDPLQLVDLRGAAAMRAGAVAAIGALECRSLTQAWSRYIYDNSAIYGNVHGLIYSGAHNGEDAIVLYERAIPVIRSAGQQVKRLSNPSLEFELLRIAVDHRMIVAP
jgi:RES domain